MKKVLKIIGIIFCCILVIVAATCLADFMYYPKYKSDREVFDISAEKKTADITLMSVNVRTWSPTDTFKKSWFYRAKLIDSNIAEVKPDIIGFQEVTPVHYKYLTETLRGYDNVIEYRDNSPLHEACPVFYNTSRFELKDKGSFWLSETPEKMSKDWGAACYRVCSYVILAEKDTKKELVVFNTHLDHVSDEARINGINVVLDKIQQFGGLPSVIMGDFNADEESETYKAATKSFFDAKYKTKKSMRGATYQKWGKRLDDKNIDYFMISKTGIKVNQYKIIDTTYNGVYPSDHFQIMIKINLT